MLFATVGCGGAALAGVLGAFGCDSVALEFTLPSNSWASLVSKPVKKQCLKMSM
jgi:hypothetical protein